MVYLYLTSSTLHFYQTLLLCTHFVESLVLALLKYPFYPLLNFDNGMNLISKSLTILTPNYWSFSRLHIYFGGTSFLQVFDQFWSMKWRGPRSRDDTKNYEGQSPNKE